MANRIDIDQSKVSQSSSNISSSASSMNVSGLSSIDNESTIAGNMACQSSFNEYMGLVSEMVGALNNEAMKIKSLGNEFKEVDNQLATMVSLLTGK